jgi:hypothetical protein
MRPNTASEYTTSEAHLPPSVDAAIVALCDALDATHMDANSTFLRHVDARLRSSLRCS